MQNLTEMSLNTKGLDTVTMVHIGVELVVIGGMATYFHTQNRDLKNRVQELEKQNAELSKVIQSHSQALNQVMLMLRGSEPSPQQRRPQKRVTRQRRPQPVEEEEQEEEFEEQPQEEQEENQEEYEEQDDDYVQQELNKTEEESKKKVRR